MIYVSIIVPVYNTEKYVEKCISSLVSQTLQEIEIIAVNDASTDGSLQILRSFESRYPGKVIVIDSKENLKAGGACNLGLEAARGEFFTTIGSDDWADATMFEKLYKKAAATGADVVDCDYCYYYGDDVPLKYQTSNQDSHIGIITDEMRKSLIINSGRICTKIIKKELFTANNIRYPSGLFYEDNALGYYVCYINKLEKVKEHLLYVRLNNVSMTRANKNFYGVFDRLKTAVMFIESSGEKGLFEKYKEEIEARFTELYYMNTIPICLFHFDKPEKKYLAEMRLYMRENFRNYRKNPYFKRFDRRQRLMARINDISPGLLCGLFLLASAVWAVVRPIFRR